LAFGVWRLAFGVWRVGRNRSSDSRICEPGIGDNGVLAYQRMGVLARRAVRRQLTFLEPNLACTLCVTLGLKHHLKFMKFLWKTYLTMVIGPIVNARDQVVASRLTDPAFAGSVSPYPPDPAFAGSVSPYPPVFFLPSPDPSISLRTHSRSASTMILTSS
jgi:hypothetical protein